MSNNNKKTIYGLYFLTFVGLAGFGVWDFCIKPKQTNTGLRYKYVTKGDQNTTCRDDQYIYFEKSIAYKGIVIEKENKHPYYPAMILCSNLKNYNFDGGQYEALNFIKHKGDIYDFFLEASDLYSDQEIVYLNDKFKTDIKQDSTLVLKVKIKDFINEDQISETLQTYMNERLEERKKESEKQMKKDIELLDKYINDQKLNVEVRESGLRYVIKTRGEGDTPKEGDTVLIEYTGKNLKGRVFDSSVEAIAKEANIYNSRRTYEPIKYKVGRDRFIEGFSEGISLCNKGCEATLFIPSKLAYGENGIDGVIEPNACLIFDIKIVDIIKE